VPQKRPPSCQGGPRPAIARAHTQPREHLVSRLRRSARLSCRLGCVVRQWECAADSGGSRPADVAHFASEI